MSAGDKQAFALRGVMDDQPLWLPLLAGANHLGSAASCQLCLKSAGISKRHAVLLVDGGRVSVADLASKNGTFVNRRRVDRAALEPGDHVAFGALSMMLEQVDPDDTRIAVDLGLPQQESSKAITTQTRNASQISADGLPYLTLATSFVEALGCPNIVDPFSNALQSLVDQLPLTGVCVFSPLDGSTGSELAFLGSVGNIDVIDVAAIRAVLAKSSPGEWLETSLSADGYSETGPMFLLLAPSRRHGLVAWGERAVAAEMRRLLRLVLAAGERLVTQQIAVKPSAAARSIPELVFPAGYVVGRSSAMVSFYRQIQPLAHSDLPVLVLGETGTGKESVAQILHASSGRAHRPLVTLNCAAIPQDLIEAELFGIGAGVATGVSARPGKFQEAHQGTLFLDEIGDLPLGLQSKLLRALQDGDVRPLGCQAKPVDVRIVAATNSDLEAKMEAGLFRHDLYYRLAGLVLKAPPLRRRVEDLPLLVTHFLRRENEKAGKAIRGLTVGAMKKLSMRLWPGNVRELEHEVRRLVYAVASNPLISADLIITAQASGCPEEAFDFRRVKCLDLGEMEKAALVEALRRAEGHVTEAARCLGITRQALRRRMSRHGL